jgi:DNA-binding CsgD family transcriptional regulator
MMAHFAQPHGLELELPRGPTGAWADIKRRLHQMIREGATSTQITRELGISRDMVKAHRAKLRVEVSCDQLSLLTLFDALPVLPEAVGALPDPAQPPLIVLDDENFRDALARRVDELIEAGASTAEVVREAGVSRNTVQNHRRNLKED